MTMFTLLHPHRALWLFALYLLVSVQPAFAQEEPVADTLDWRGYYPLEVGNTWEYRITLGAFDETTEYERREIAEDTLIGDTHFYIHVAQRYELTGRDSTLELRWRYVDFVRYDATGAAIAAIPADSTRRSNQYSQAWPGSPFLYDYNSESLTCKLDAAFGAHFTCSTTRGEQEVRVTGGYEGESFGDIDINANKHFTPSGSEYGPFFLHGLGQIIGELVYARVGDDEFSTSQVTRLATFQRRQAYQAEQAIRIEATYPNPFRRSLTVRYHLRTPMIVQFGLFDVLGRRVLRDEVHAVRPGSHKRRLDLTDLPSGLYLLRLSTLDGEQVARHVVGLE